MIERKCENGFITRHVKLSVLQEGDSLFSETTTNVEIIDEGTHEFVEVSQQSDHVSANKQAIQICKKEWPALKSAIESMLDECGDCNDH